MGWTATVIPLHAAESDAYDPDRLRLRPEDIPTTKAETGLVHVQARYCASGGRREQR